MAKNTKNIGGDLVSLDRRTTDRRGTSADTSAEPRRKQQRRRHIDPTTCEREYDNNEIEFMHAMDDYKRSSGRMFPTCSEVLEVLHGMGYTKLTPEQRQLLAGTASPCDANSEVQADSIEFSTK